MTKRDLETINAHLARELSQCEKEKRVLELEVLNLEIGIEGLKKQVTSLEEKVVQKTNEINKLQGENFQLRKELKEEMTQNGNHN